MWNVDLERIIKEKQICAEMGGVMRSLRRIRRCCLAVGIVGVFVFAWVLACCAGWKSGVAALVPPLTYCVAAPVVLGLCGWRLGHEIRAREKPAEQMRKARKNCLMVVGIAVGVAVFSGLMLVLGWDDFWASAAGACFGCMMLGAFAAASALKACLRERRELSE